MCLDGPSVGVAGGLLLPFLESGRWLKITFLKRNKPARRSASFRLVSWTHTMSSGPCLASPYCRASHGPSPAVHHCHVIFRNIHSHVTPRLEIPVTFPQSTDSATPEGIAEGLATDVGHVPFIPSRWCWATPRSSFPPTRTSQCTSASPCFLCPSRVSRRSSVSGAKSQSTGQFVTALVFNAAAFAIQVVAFTFLRPYFRVIYEPRSYIPLESFVSFGQYSHARIPPNGLDQETRPTSVPESLRLAACNMEGGY
jgi:hypothetical protein